MSDKFGEGRDPYLYPGLDIMRNRLNIRQQQRLEQAAYEMTALRAATIELGPLVRGLPHLRTIHRQLYQDIFDWAGQLREVDIYQGDTPFCHFAYIEKEGNALMQDLEEEGYLVGLEKAKFVERLAHYYCEINVLHPFRVGSGLAQRIFFEQLAIHAGYQLSWQGIEKEAWNQANQSGAMGDLTALQMIFSKVVSEAGDLSKIARFFCTGAAMILLIDNYDSFTWNLYQYFCELGADVLVKRNDALTLADIDALKPQKIVISPGPCTPDEAGISLDVIRHYAGRLPILGVCLGHQAMAQAFGGKVVRAAKVMHGKTSPITHNGEGVFRGLANPLTVTRYHSLVVEPDSLPACFDVTAWSETREIMGIRHRQWDLEGVQFHPESILSEQGHQLLANFLHR